VTCAKHLGLSEFTYLGLAPLQLGLGLSIMVSMLVNILETRLMTHASHGSYEL